MSEGRARKEARGAQPGDTCPVCRMGTFREVQTRWGPEWWCTVCQPRIAPRIARLEPRGEAGDAG